MDSDDGVTALLEQFQAVLSGDPHAGPQAEENIKSARSEPGFPVALTRIILAEEVCRGAMSWRGFLLRSLPAP